MTEAMNEEEKRQFEEILRKYDKKTVEVYHNISKKERGTHSQIRRADIRRAIKELINGVVQP